MVDDPTGQAEDVAVFDTAAVDPGAPKTTGTARMVHSGPDFEAVHAAVKAKYGLEYQLMTKLIGPLVARRKGLHYGDTVVLITPEQ